MENASHCHQVAIRGRVNKNQLLFYASNESFLKVSNLEVTYGQCSTPFFL